MIPRDLLDKITQRDVEILAIGVMFRHIIISAEAVGISKEEILEMFEGVWRTKDKGPLATEGEIC